MTILTKTSISDGQNKSMTLTPIEKPILAPVGFWIYFLNFPVKLCTILYKYIQAFSTCVCSLALKPRPQTEVVDEADFVHFGVSVERH